MVSNIRVGVIGLGNMGAALAQRLQELVAEVVVHDVRTEAVKNAVQRGAKAASSPREVGKLSDVIVTSLPSPDISLEVAQEVAEDKQLRAYVETSTVGPYAVQKMASMLAAPVIDAPLSGGPHGILNGKITSYVAGPEATRNEISDWFDGLCTNQVLVGEQAGAAQIAKLVNNAVSLSGMAIACEAIAVGVAAGMDPKTAVESVNSGTGRNSATESKIPKSVLTGTFDFGGPVVLAEKDLELYQSLAKNAGILESLTDSALEAFRAAILKFGANSDYTEIARIFESAVGAEIRHRPVAIGQSSSGRSWRSEYLD